MWCCSHSKANERTAPLMAGQSMVVPVDMLVLLSVLQMVSDCRASFCSTSIICPSRERSLTVAVMREMRV